MVGRLKGTPKTGGRKKGTPNLKTLESKVRERILLKQEITPLEFLLAGMKMPMPKGKAATYERKIEVQQIRIECAKAAAPYVHPKLNAIHHTGLQSDKDELVFNRTEPALLEAARRIAFVMAMGAKAAQAGVQTIEGESTTGSPD